MVKSMIISFGCQKGGVGKSTLGCSLVAELLRRGEDVILVDADPSQGSSDDWARWRDQSIEEGEDLSPAQTVNLSGDISRRLKDLEKKYEYVVVDVQGRDSPEWRSALRVAHINITPTGPDPIDINTLAATQDRVNDFCIVNPDLKQLYILNKCDTRDRNIEVNKAIYTLKEMNKELTEPLVYLSSWIYDRKAWPTSFGSGCGITDWSDQSAIDEFMILYNAIIGG